MTNGVRETCLPQHERCHLNSTSGSSPSQQQWADVLSCVLIGAKLLMSCEEPFFFFLLRWYAMRHKVYMHIKTRLVEERKQKRNNVKETSTEWRTNMSPPADASFGIANLRRLGDNA